MMLLWSVDKSVISTRVVSQRDGSTSKLAVVSWQFSTLISYSLYTIDIVSPVIVSTSIAWIPTKNKPKVAGFIVTIPVTGSTANSDGKGCRSLPNWLSTS